MLCTVVTNDSIIILQAREIAKLLPEPDCLGYTSQEACFPISELLWKYLRDVNKSLSEVDFYTHVKVSYEVIHNVPISVSACSLYDNGKLTFYFRKVRVQQERHVSDAATYLSGGFGKIAETKDKPKTKTLGEQLVGIDFNPTQEVKVTNIKKIFAALIDDVLSCNTRSHVDNIIRGNAIQSLINAQMATIKAMTFDYDANKPESHLYQYSAPEQQGD